MDVRFHSCLVLGVGADASAAEVKVAYRRLAREWHPDRQTDPRRRKQAEEKLRDINRAYEALERLFSSPSFHAGDHAPRSKPANPPYSIFDLRQGMAEQSRTEESTQDEQAFYVRALRLHFDGMERFREGLHREAISALMQSVCLVQDNFEAYL